MCVRATIITLASLLLAAAAPARAADGDGPLAVAVDGAVGSLERAVPFGQPFRVAIAPIVGPGEAETGLGEYIAGRAASRLVARGIEVVDRSYVQALRDADRARPGGPTGESPEKLAALYLRADAVISGTVLDVGDAFELGLRLSDARAGKVLVMGSARLEKGEATLALVGAHPAPSALAAPLAIERAVFVKRKTADGYAEPTIWDGKPLAREDLIQIRIRPAEACFLCVAVFQASGRMKILLPEDATETGRVKASAGALVKLPPREGNFWYPFSDPGGVESFFVIAEREAVKTARAEAKGAEIGKLEEERLAAKAKAESLADAREKSEADRRMSELWQLEQGSVKELRAELEGAVNDFVFDFRVRQAFDALAHGDAPPDEVRLRDLGKPIEGGPVDIVWEGGKIGLPTGRVEGSGRIVESFAIAHK
jgi:hypothetical protein